MVSTAIDVYFKYYPSHSPPKKGLFYVIDYQLVMKMWITCG